MTMMERFTRADSRVSYRLPFPDYPSNARSFVHLDAKLLPYWHALFDVCPRLLKLDPPEGLEIFRQFMTWAYGCQLALDWTFHSASAAGCWPPTTASWSSRSISRP